MKKKNGIVVKKPTLRKVSDDESYESFIEESSAIQSENIYSSTPKKNVRSTSLLNLSEIESDYDKLKSTTNTSVLSSSSSLCKDSGFNNSQSSLISDKAKPEVSFNVINEKYLRLVEEMKYKDVLIATLQDSNQNLRMKYAEAENKISELRLKCELHCNCCATKTPNTLEDEFEFKRHDSRFQPEIKHFKDFSLSPVSIDDNLFTQPVNYSPLVKEPTRLPNDDSFIKVERWQESQRRLSSPASLDQKLIYIRPIRPEPLTQPLTYMETSRALAEAHKKRRGLAQDLVRFQLIGDRSVSVTPVHAVSHFPVDFSSCESEDSPDDAKINSEDSPTVKLNENHPAYLSTKQESATLFNRILLNHQNSFDLFECLSKASEYARHLTTGLSNLGPSLDHVRELSMSNLD